ncbi:hypothetical protein Scep_008534 [Stephania cephalantha]|uniref:Uncharacterized protein n=1 Tax=Stephania cephalantha TaxID=152367 RepID=A0AAP0KEH6_9MAGN
MGSESALRLPIVDFIKEDLKPGSPEWDSLKTQVKQALQEYGCFEALYNKVPSDLSIDLYEGLEELFDLPLQTKLRNRSNKPFHGYYDHIVFKCLFLDLLNINTVNLYAKQLVELDHMVRRMVLESLGVDKYYDEHIESTNYLLRVMKYKGPQTSEAKMGLNSHTDKNILTILHQNQVAGLEVQTKDGEWFDVKPSPNSFIVM